MTEHKRKSMILKPENLPDIQILDAPFVFEGRARIWTFGEYRVKIRRFQLYEESSKILQEGLTYEAYQERCDSVLKVLENVMVTRIMVGLEDQLALGVDSIPLSMLVLGVGLELELQHLAPGIQLRLELDEFPYGIRPIGYIAKD